MAARKGIPSKIQQEQTRAAIKTTQLVKRLQSYALGEKENKPNKEGETSLIELDAGRLKAIEILLRKSLPDLAAVQVTGDPDQPLVHKVERTIIDPPKRDE